MNALHIGTRALSARQAVMWGLIAFLLVLPAIAMRFTHEVNWTAFDFAVAAMLLVGGGALYELAARLFADRRLRMAAGAAILFVVALIWLQGAVGIF